jgi:hypothetical protein
MTAIRLLVRNSRSGSQRQGTRIRDFRMIRKRLVRPARLERATSWFVVGARVDVLNDIVSYQDAFSSVIRVSGTPFQILWRPVDEAQVRPP